MIRTTKKIDFALNSKQNLPINWWLVELEVASVTIDSIAKKVIFRYTEKAFRYEDETQEDGSTEQKVRKDAPFPTGNKTEPLEMQDYFNLIDTIESSVPQQVKDALTTAELYDLVADEGLKYMIVSQQFYKGLLTNTDFE